MKKTKELSVIIPTALKNPKFLQGALESLERNTASDYEVIVVVNGSGLDKVKKVAEVYGAIVLEPEENLGYGGGMNLGFAVAKGEYLVGSNDDVLFTPEWDLNLREVLDTFHKKQTYPKCGIVGPCTNFAGGVQHVPLPGLTAENVDQAAEKFREENLDNWVCTSFISGFCFMVTREFYGAMVEEDGFFFDHETFPIGGCFPKGEKVLTSFGPKDLDKIEKGDRVLTHKGRFMPVTSVMSRQYVGDLVSIRPYGGEAASMTTNHPVLVMDKDTHETKWVAAGEISEADYLTFPRYTKVSSVSSIVFRDNISRRDRSIGEVQYSEDLFWLLGLWAAEGSAFKRGSGSNSGHVLFSLGAHEVGTCERVKEVMLRLFNRTPTEQTKGRENSVQLSYSVVALADFLVSEFGDGESVNCYSKRIPEFVLNAKKSFVESFVQGYVEGDGNIEFGNANQTRINISTISPQLAYGTKLLFSKLGILASVHSKKNNVFRSKDTNEKHPLSYQIRFSQSLASDSLLEKLGIMRKGERSFHRYIILEDKIGVPIFELSRESFMGEVFNCEVQEDNSYSALGFMTHNSEDNDLCARAVRRGWSPVVAGNCYVYHYGSRTLKNFPELAGGVNNLIHLYKKWKPTEPQVLGALYRVKMLDEDSKNDWLRSLEQTYKFADRIYILNDQSVKEFWPTEDELAPFQDKIRTLINISHKQMESDDRQQLYDAARKDACDWVISIDHDEILEDKFDYAYAQRLMAVPQPICCGYVFHWYHLWNDEGYWRSDGNRGQFAGVRMCRVLPKFYIPKRAFHVGNIPHMPKHVWVTSSVRIKHLGQMRKKERERKYEYYESHDVVKEAKLIGNEDYSHIKDETHAVIEPWVESNSLSVTTIMRDEETHLHHFLNQYAMFADEIILVDTGSNDRSVEVAKLWGATVLHHKWEDDFSGPRNKGLKACTKDWILHLDIDEVAPELGKIRRMMEIQSTDGYLFYVNNVLPNGKSALSETVRLMRNNGKWFYTGYVHETVDEAVKLHKLKLHRATTGINHSGFLQDKDKMKAKLAGYLRMNLRQLKDSPNDARAYYNTAMHFLEADFDQVGKYLLKKAIELNGKFIQPINELAMYHATRAQQCYKYLVTILPENHVLVGGYRDSIGMLDQIREDRDPIDISHVFEVLQEEEFVDIGKRLSELAERG